MNLVPGSFYKVLQFAWAEINTDNHLNITYLGEFIRKRPDIYDWNNIVLEFLTEDNKIIIFRFRPIHKFIEYNPYINIEYNPYKKFMRMAEDRNNAIINGISLKEELMAKIWKPRHVTPEQEIHQPTHPQIAYFQ